MSRSASIHRQTTETDIRLSLELDGGGSSSVKTGVGFLDHMLKLFARHGLFDLSVEAHGDLHVDQHHTVEDVGICLGQALRQALGDKKGIARYGSITLPMDEALVSVAVDLSGRAYFVWRVEIGHEKIGDFDPQLLDEFWQAVAFNGLLNLHVVLHYGRNRHHIAEATFKAVTRALRQAVAIDPRVQGVPSTKGTL